MLTEDKAITPSSKKYTVIKQDISVDFVQILFDVFLGGDRGDSEQGEPPQPGEGFEEHHCLMVLPAASIPCLSFLWENKYFIDIVKCNWV